MFKDEFLRWRWKPSLRVAIVLASPDCHKTLLTYQALKPAPTYIAAECYYLCIWVENVGRTRAEKVQVFVAKLLKRHADGSFKEVEDFLPMNLCWAHGQQGLDVPEIFTEEISPQMGKHCDLCYIIDPQYRKDVGYDLPTVAADEYIAGQYSIRINDQWRICFEWVANKAQHVEIVDYHS